MIGYGLWIGASLIQIDRNIVHKYLGIPFKWGGTDAAGLDCWQLFRAIYKDLGVDVWQTDRYPKDPNESHNLFIENYHKEWEPVVKLAPFDAVLMKDKNGNAAHIGVVLLNRRFIHCPRVGVIVSHLDDPAWAPKIAGYYRLKKWSR